MYANKKYTMKYEDTCATLTISPTELTDTATYRCEADNKVARVETDAMLTVMGMLVCVIKNNLDIVALKL